MPAIINDFKAIGGALRKQRIDDWWQPAKPEPEPSVQKTAKESTMTNLVDRLRMQANAFINLNLVAVAWTGHESSQEETAIITDLREAADRIADLELTLVELSQTSGSPSNVANASVLASRVRWAARRALEHKP